MDRVQIFIASPSDTFAERKLLAYELPIKFMKYGYSKICGSEISVIGWEDLPPQSGHPQTIINTDLIIKSDILIAIFRHQLGSPVIDPETGKKRAQSGTAEELLFAIDRNNDNQKPLAMAYYYEFPPEQLWLRPKRKKKWHDLQKFKKDLKNKILYKLYNDNHEEFLTNICRDISENILNHRILK